MCRRVSFTRYERSLYPISYQTLQDALSLLKLLVVSVEELHPPPKCTPADETREFLQRLLTQLVDALMNAVGKDGHSYADTLAVKNTRFDLTTTTLF